MGLGILEVKNVTQRFANRAILDNLSLDFWGDMFMPSWGRMAPVNRRWPTR
jgi:hypothetical protein